MPRPIYGTPDPDRALRDYQALAPGYDASCALLGPIRRAAIAALALRPGESVIDVACGTGAALPLLAQAVGPQGRVVGIEQSAEMLTLARRRLAGAGLSARATLVESAAQRAALPQQADALLFCYTHDVLQTPAALRAIFAAARPGARVAVAGMRFLPWWAAPANLWLRLRARRYVTTFEGMQEPWAPLAAYCPDLRVLRTFHLGTSYLATATYAARTVLGEPGGAAFASAELR
jgi:demethylmenaquinone methyltransferase/2-methoxy-6-polyprenyl-1,4-benzoquinol methylase